jgi:hypothetical protein
MRREGTKSGSRTNGSVGYKSAKAEEKNFRDKSRSVARQTSRDTVKAHKSKDLVAFG